MHMLGSITVIRLSGINRQQAIAVATDVPLAALLPPCCRPATAVVRSYNRSSYAFLRSQSALSVAQLVPHSSQTYPAILQMVRKNMPKWRDS
jgi:hypothetical protein